MSANPTVQIEDPFVERPQPISKFALFNYGFRPFFFLAGLFAAISVPLWVGLYAGHMDMGLVSSPMLWHGHEMIYGYTAAAIAGFFLTVVPNWTKVKASKGPILVFLAALWLIGRVAFWAQSLLPYSVVMALDLLFLIALTAVVIRPLINPQYRRQFVFVPILVVMIVANAMTHLGVLGFEAFGVDWGVRGLVLGLDATLVLITVMAGRVTPSFTSSYLGHGDPDIKVVQRAGLDRWVVWTMWLLLVVDFFLPVTPWAGAVAIAAAALHVKRLSGWQSLRTLDNPILWVLHLGYVWLIVGLVLRGLSDFDLIPAADAVHALTIGALGTITLAIMTRASLGHTGRGIKAAPVIVVAYVLVSLSAIVRLAAVWLVDMSLELVMVSGVLWTLAFVAFFIVYAPILMRPRIDGRPG